MKRCRTFDTTGWDKNKGTDHFPRGKLLYNRTVKLFHVAQPRFTVKTDRSHRRQGKKQFAQMLSAAWFDMQPFQSRQSVILKGHDAARRVDN